MHGTVAARSLTKDRREGRYVRLNLRPLPLAARMTRLAAVCAPSAMWARVRDGVLVTQVGRGGGLSVGHVLFLTIRPHPSEKKEREKETGPVQIDYSNHLEDSENERRGGRRKWDTTTSRGHSLCDTPTVQYDHCLRDA